MSMALDHPISAETILDDLMRTYTATIPIFIRHKMLCIGCPVVRLHDVRQACWEHGIALDAFLDEVNLAIAESRSPS